MDTIYSMTLLVSLSAGILGNVYCLLQWNHLGAKGTAQGRILPIVLSFAIIALFTGAVSLVVHRVDGHGADSGELMALLHFLAQHRAYWLVPALCLLLFVAWGITSWAGRNDDH
jgi:H+/Cl- antiporter ClcA